MMRGGSAARRAAAALASPEMWQSIKTTNSSLVVRGFGSGGGNQQAARRAHDSLGLVRRPFHSSAAAAHALGPVGAAAASVGARAAMGLMAKSLKLRAAQSAYKTVTTESFRSKVQHIILGRTYAGSAARVAGLSAATGAGLYSLVVRLHKL
jgi:hypothetical protein